MEELNNNLVEETMEVIEPVEILETIESVKESSSKGLVVTTLLIAGVIAGGYGLKKLWDKKQAKNNTSSETIIEIAVEDDEEIVDQEETI